MRDTVLGESLRKIEAEGLKPRPITRDLDWGIPVPVEGWRKRESASTSGSRPSSAISPPPIEWSQSLGTGRSLARLVDRIPTAKQFYFIGKDNIFFHTRLWPAELMGAGAQFLKIFAEEEGPLDPAL